jgi:hypothetical protein
VLFPPRARVLAAALLFAHAASAEEPDTTYGRVDGDLGFVGGAGVAVGARTPRAALDLRLRYLDTAGVFITYEDGSIFSSAETRADPRRVLAGGIEIRPLFLARWLRGRETGVGHLDLAIDSLGLELGAFTSQPDGASSLAERPGLQLGMGLELPVLAQASGPWIGLHPGVRWSDAALGGDPVRVPSDRALYLAITLSWHQLFGAHVVDVHDRAAPPSSAASPQRGLHSDL